MKLKTILNEIRLNEFGDSSKPYKVSPMPVGKNNSSYRYRIEDETFKVDGKQLKNFVITAHIAPITDSEASNFDHMLLTSPYYKYDNDEYNKKYANCATVSFISDYDYKSISNDIKIAIRVMGTVVSCVLDAITKFQKSNTGHEVHFIQYGPASQVKKDRKTGDVVSDDGAKRDKLYRAFIEPRVTGYFSPNNASKDKLIQFDKIK
jgi:hypothetical protein